MLKLLSGILVAMAAIAQLSFLDAPKEKIKWISFEELSKQYAANPKPILIDIYTDWCGWCKKMDNSTYENPKLVQYVNEKYYAVKFNAENTAPIKFNGKEYKYDQANNVHQLAVYFTAGQLAFPHTIFLSAISAQPAPVPGYMKASEIEGPLKYFGENANAKMSFVDFDKSLKRSF